MKRAFLLLALFVPGCESPPTAVGAWRPTEGARSPTWEQAQEVCGLLLQKGQVAALTGGDAEIEVRAPYDACMRQQGWELRDEADERSSRAMLEEVNAFLDREIRSRRTKAEFERAFGTAECRPLAPGTEVCVWEFDYRSDVAEASYPAMLTCLLPEDGSPRPDGSCQFDAK